MTLGYPWALLLLIILLFLPKHPFRWLRALALVALMVALAQPKILGPSQQLSIVLDVSDSITTTSLDIARANELDKRGELFAFATDVTALESLEIPDFLDTSQTDIAKTLQVLSAQETHRALIISDGRASVGDALASLPNFPVDTFYIPSQPRLRLSRLIVPSEVNSGETVEVSAVIQSDTPTTVTINPFAGNAALEPITQTIPAGQSVVPFRFKVEGQQDINLSVTLSNSQHQDSLNTILNVLSAAPILVIDDPAMLTLLRAQGFNAVAGVPEDIHEPLDYSAIILRGGASQYTQGQLELLEHYVLSGGGLMMTGGPTSFGFGSWYRTPLESVLPVNTDLRTEVQLPLVALVMILDRSQSMSSGNPSKLELAKEGALNVVDLAYQEDLLGMVIFSDGSATQWAFEPRKATEQGKREMAQAILNIDPRGGTVLRPAYEMALAKLQEIQASIKHVIILSDGKLYDAGSVFGGSGNEVDFNVVASTALQLGITTSTIAIGSEADFERMEAIARAGGGRYYKALEVSTLPRIFTNEALTATRSLIREEPLVPILRSHPLVATNETPPPLNAYIATSLKPSSEVILEGQEQEPILALSRQGLGRSAALTTDLNGWAGDLLNWSALTSILGTLVRWLQANPAQYEATVTRQGTQLHVVVDAVKHGEYINDKQLELRYGNETTTLEQSAPGRYETFIPAKANAETLLVIDGSDIVARTQLPKSSEFDNSDGQTLLRTLSERTGGQVIETLEGYQPSTTRAQQALWPFIALAGLGLFLLELILRRITPNQALSIKRRSS
jgi:Mg-chelatase subunit ChlD